LYGQRFTVTFTSNLAAATGDSVRVLYTTAGCGNSARKAAKLANTLLAAPAAPASITIAIKADVCNARKYRYIAPSPLPGATATAGAANGYLWSTPTGTVGSTGTIDSGSVNSSIITVTYTSNAAAGVGDSIRLLYTSAGCGNGAIKAAKLSNLVKAGCPPIAKSTEQFTYVNGSESISKSNNDSIQCTGEIIWYRRGSSKGVGCYWSFYQERKSIIEFKCELRIGFESWRLHARGKTR
jgi:hypothetical protein